LKQGRGFAVTKAQRVKVAEAFCLYCGRDRASLPIDPAHLWDRSRGGCDDPACIVPLCRECHRAYDEHRLDLLPLLVEFGYWAEMAHVIAEHHVSPARLLERLTGSAHSVERSGGHHFGYE
jgi:hypothetical protein